MSIPANPLPPDVLDALQRGQTVEAIKLLRQSTGLGLKEAKDAIDAHMHGTPVSIAAAANFNPLPPSVVAALQRGNKIEAIKLLCEQSGLGLKEAKDAVEAFHQPMKAKPGRPSPFIVQRSEGFPWWGVVLAVAGLAAYYFFRG